MADKRIIDFPTLTEADDDDLLLISSQNDSYNIKVATLKKATNEVAAKAVEDAAAALDNTETMQEQLSALNLGIEQIVPGLSDEAKNALLACFAHVAWIDEHGQDYYDALEEALNDIAWIVTNTLNNCTSSNAASSVKKGLPYTATLTANIGYTLTGANVLIKMNGVDITSTAYSNGIITIGSVTGNLTITVSAVAVTLSSISATYTQTEAIYQFDDLDTLKNELVVIGTYADGSTVTIPDNDYTLSGTLNLGINIITVSYGGFTDTFSVNVTDIDITNNSSMGSFRPADDGKWYFYTNTGLTARCRFTNLIKNRNYTFSVVDSNKYNISGFDNADNVLRDFTANGEPKVGYLMPENLTPAWATAFTATSNYVAIAFKKMDGTDFTTDEIENAEGTIFVVGKQSNVVAWNADLENQKWVDKDLIIGVTDPFSLALAADYSIKGTRGTICACPMQDNSTVGRATSISQVLIGDYDGKTVELTRYTLSTGRNIAFAVFYSYLDNNGRFNGDQIIAYGNNNEFLFGKWNTSSLVLPTDSSIIGKRVLIIGFKNNDSNTTFTQAELREIPTLIRIQ